MADFATISDIEDFLQLTIAAGAPQDSASRALAEASEAIRNYCRQFIDYVYDDDITVDTAGGWKLLLPELPVISVSTVVELGTTLVVDVDYRLGDHGILHRLNAQWPDYPKAVRVVYDHGFMVTPTDIVGVCTRAASRAYQAGLKSLDTEGVPGISSKSLGDFSVAYASEASGGSDGGTMGASAARILLLSEKDILNRYRA